MSHFLWMIDRLPAPHISLDEQSFVMPEGQANEIDNPNCKIVFVLGADCAHQHEAAAVRPCRTGDVLAFPGPCRHRYIPQAGKSHRIHAARLLIRRPSKKTRGRRKSGGEPTSLTELVGDVLTEFRHLSGAISPTMLELLWQFRREAEQQALGYKIRAAALCTELVVETLRLIAPAQVDELTRRGAAVASHEAAHLIERAKEWLYKNHARPITLDDAARHLDVSREHLARAFRKATGTTLFGLLQQIRLERAKSLLLGSDLSIAETAAAAGFSSLALFSRTFQARYQMSPRRYRQTTWEHARDNLSLPQAKSPRGR
ncbi:MAG: AraC family transcriptional regulator [Pirellulales bacterium]